MEVSESTTGMVAVDTVVDEEDNNGEFWLLFVCLFVKKIDFDIKEKKMEIKRKRRRGGE